MDKLPPWVTEDLVRLPFVQWDRFTQDEQKAINLYGWIDREQDSYKDFVLLTYKIADFDEHGNMVVLTVYTSSAKHSEEIGHLLKTDGHSDCMRIEDYADIPNCIRLNKINHEH